MIEQDTIKLLRECDAGVKMGTSSIEDVLDNVKSEKLEKLLTECKNEHKKLDKEIQQLLDKYQDDGKEPAVIAKGMSWMKTNMKLAMEEYDAAESPYSLKQFGRARAYVLRSDIVLRHGKGSADERKQMAIDRLEMANSLFEETVGLYHPESADCQERLKHLKS